MAYDIMNFREGGTGNGNISLPLRVLRCCVWRGEREGRKGVGKGERERREGKGGKRRGEGREGKMKD